MFDKDVFRETVLFRLDCWPLANIIEAERRVDHIHAHDGL